MGAKTGAVLMMIATLTRECGSNAHEQGSGEILSSTKSRFRSNQHWTDRNAGVGKGYVREERC